MPRKQCEGLSRGEGCPTCAEATLSEHGKEQDFFIADLDLSRLRLATNQFVTGYCVLVCHRHVREPTSAAGVTAPEPIFTEIPPSGRLSCCGFEG